MMNENDRPSNRPVLTLVERGAEVHTAGRPVRVVRAPEGRPPFPVRARVYEEDTFFVLSAPAVLPETTEHPIRLMTDVYDARAATPGTVAVKGRGPYRLLAVVHDLERSPTWREEWVAAALVEALARAEGLGVAALALPVLGGVHGNLGAERFLPLLDAALAATPARRLERIWLVTGAGPPAASPGIG